MSYIRSSSGKVLEAFLASEKADTSEVLKLEQLSKPTALDLVRNTISDRITIRSNIPDRPFARRGVLSIVNSTFGSLGIVSPILLEGRLM